MSNILINYGDISVGAKEAFVPETTDKEDFVNLADMQASVYPVENYGNPCDLYSVVLDGSASPVPADTSETNVGYWSEQTTDENGDFETPIVMTLKSATPFSSSGIAFEFDTFKNIYCTSLSIEWKLNGTTLMRGLFAPNASRYFCTGITQNYDEVIVTFYSLNMPNNRLRIFSIDHGQRFVFRGDELKSAEITQECDPISSQLPISSFSFAIESKKNENFSFKNRQPVTVYFNDKLRITSFVKTAKRTTKTTWSVACEDYIGILEGTPFYGGIYKDMSAYDLALEIFTKANVPFDFDEELKTQTVGGYIPYTTCRNALMQLAFAIGAAVSTHESDKVKVFPLSNESGSKVTLDKIMQGQNFEEETLVTAVEVVGHGYSRKAEDFIAYKAEESGTGTNIFVKFPEPLWGLEVSKDGIEMPDRIVESGDNYAIINISAGEELSGGRYEHTTFTKRIENPDKGITNTENIITISDATLVSSENIDNVLLRCYNHFDNDGKVNMKIVEGRNDYTLHTSVSDYINFETEYMGDMGGRIVRQRYSLNGGILVKDSVVLRGGA